VPPSSRQGTGIIFKNKTSSAKGISFDVRRPVDGANVKVKDTSVFGRHLFQQLNGVFTDKSPFVSCKIVEARHGTMGFIVKANLTITRQRELNCPHYFTRTFSVISYQHGGITTHPSQKIEEVGGQVMIQHDINLVQSKVTFKATAGVPKHVTHGVLEQSYSPLTFNLSPGEWIVVAGGAIVYYNVVGSVKEKLNHERDFEPV